MTLTTQRPAAAGTGDNPGRPRRRVATLGRLTVRRALLSVPVVLAVSVGVFALAAASPFDPLQGYLDERYFTTTAADRAALAETLGLGQGWWSQYLTWLTAALGGDLGWSRVFSQPVLDVVTERLPWTMLLTGTALVVAVVLSVALAVATVRHPGSLLDRVVTGIAHAIEGIPSFLVAIGAISVFSLGLGLLPTGGLGPPGQPLDAATVLRHLLLPASVLAVSILPWPVLHLRQSLLTAMTEDHVRGARARGLPEGVVLRRHALPGALLPFTGLLGARLPELITGAVIVETVFSWPGVAEATVRSAVELDFPLLAALTLAGTVAVLVGTWLSDCAIVLLDPRVRADA